MNDRKQKESLIVSLPPLKPEQYESFTFEKKPQKTKQEESCLHQWEELLDEHKEVSTSLRREIDGAMRDIKRPLDLRKTDERGRVIIPALGHPIRVSPKMYPKAVELIEAFLTRLVELGTTAPFFRRPRFRVL